MKLHHFIVVLVFAFIWVSPVYAQQSAEQLYQSGLYKEEIKGELAAAIKIYETIINKHSENRSVAAKVLLHIGICKERLGMKEAAYAYQKVVNSYPEQTEAVKAANEKLSLLLRAEAVAGKENKEFSIKKVSEALTNGTISPDGRYLSYVDDDTGDLAIYEIATGMKSRLTKSNGSWDEYVESSRWSPDGKQIVYNWYNKNADIDFCIVGLDGSKPRILYSDDKGNSWARTYDWSPDGKNILAILCKIDGQKQLVLVSTTDGSVRVLKVMEQGWPNNMNFSPDGRYIVYDFKQKEDTQVHDISILSIDGSREIPLVEHPADDKVLGWAPDGKNILFASDRRNTTDAWVIQFSDGKVQGIPKLVKSNVGKVYPMGFTRKGSFCYSIIEVLRDIYFAELDPETNKMLVPPKRQSTRFEGSLRKPEYSPDGKYVAYISERAANSFAVSIQSLETGKMQEFPTKLLSNMTSLRWSPDGRLILVGGWSLTGGKGIYRIDTQSGIFTLIVPPAKFTGNFAALTTHDWSHDGKAIFLGRLATNLPNQTQIMLRDIESGTEKELYRGPGLLLLSCSPNGKWLALMNRYTGGFLKIMPAAGGEPRELYRFKKEDNLQEIRWTPDGKYILVYKNQPPEEKYSWWRIPMEGGEPQKLGLEWNTLIYTSFHPDGRHIVFSSHDSKSENSGNYVMENFLPEVNNNANNQKSDKPLITGTELTTRRVLADASGLGDDGVLTPDGKYFSYIDEGTGDVVQFEVASGQTSRITNKGPWKGFEKGSGNDQVFSRDGKQIAYESYTKDNVLQLRIRNLDGSGLRTFYSEKGLASIWLVGWSPDARSILARKAGELTLISTADGSVRVLKSVPSVGSFASFSPDGRFVAISSVFEGNPAHSDVFLMTADGRNEIVVAGHPAEDQLLGWTPDGRSLLFLSDRSGTWDIWTVHITGGKQQGEPELLKKDFGWDSWVLGFAPDGSLYYKTETALGGFYNGTIDLETGKVLAPPAPVKTRYTGPPWMPTWSPDGRNLAYISRMGTIGPRNNILTIRSAATGEERFLSPRLRAVAMPSWAPDGRSVIANGMTEKGSGIFRIDIETSAITKLADQNRFAPRLCPDGKTLVFVMDGIIRKRNLDTGEESEVIKARTRTYDLSPDGREVVFQVNDTVKTVSLNGGEPRELFHGLAKSYALKWTRDGRYIIAQARGTSSSEIWRVPAHGGTPLKLDLSVPKMDDFSFVLHPDNSHFVFSINEGSKSELWVLENFLPK